MHSEQHRGVPPRLRDAGTGELAVLARAVGVRVVVEPGRPSATLRAALTADLVRRVAELRGGQARVTASTPLPDLTAHNVHPAATVGEENADVVVGEVVPGRLSLEVGPVEPEGSVSGPPLAARLLLLGERYRRPVRLEPQRLAEGEERLRRWRDLVVEWAGFPSAGMPASYVEAMRDRAADDLDTPGVLALLDRVAADDQVPPGGRFEFFMYADRLLGLDLAAHLSG